MGKYELLLTETPVKVYDNAELPDGIKGLYVETDGRNLILLDRSLRTAPDYEKYCVLAEEIGHHYMTFGNIVNQYEVNNRKKEKKARNWAYKKLVPYSSFIEAFHANARNRYEFAELIGVTEEFLEQSINHYHEVHGLSVQYLNYVISFDPLGVTQLLI